MPAAAACRSWARNETANDDSACTAAELELLATTPQAARAAVSTQGVRMLPPVALLAGLALALVGASAAVVLPRGVRLVPKLAGYTLAEFGTLPNDVPAGVVRLAALLAGANPHDVVGEVVRLVPLPAGLAGALPGTTPHVAYPCAWAPLLHLAGVLDGPAVAVLGAP